MALLHLPPLTVPFCSWAFVCRQPQASITVRRVDYSHPSDGSLDAVRGPETPGRQAIPSALPPPHTVRPAPTLTFDGPFGLCGFGSISSRTACPLRAGPLHFPSRSLMPWWLRPCLGSTSAMSRLLRLPTSQRSSARPLLRLIHPHHSRSSQPSHLRSPSNTQHLYSAYLSVFRFTCTVAWVDYVFLCGDLVSRALILLLELVSSSTRFSTALSALIDFRRSHTHHDSPTAFLEYLATEDSSKHRTLVSDSTHSGVPSLPSIRSDRLEDHFSSFFTFYSHQTGNPTAKSFSI